MYNRRQIYLSDDPTDADLPVKIADPLLDHTPGVIKLYRYTLKRYDTPPGLGSYWSECLTENPEIASAATGILVSHCRWRLEWSFPAADFERNVRIKERRRMVLTSITEYRNNVIPRTEDLQPFEMREATRTSELVQMMQTEDPPPAHWSDDRRPRGRVSTIISWIRRRFF